MINFQNAGYKTEGLQTLNHCRLSLQVTTLAKIVDHTGHCLLTEALTDGKTVPMLTNVSKTNYVWPNQPSPSKSAWKFWTKALQTIFTKPRLPNQLHWALGPWNPNASIHHMWHATFNTRNKAVYLHVPSNHPQCFELARPTCSYSFYQQPQTTQQRPTKYPLTLDPQCSGFCICLPISSIPSLTPATIIWKDLELSTTQSPGSMDQIDTTYCTTPWVPCQLHYSRPRSNLYGDQCIPQHPEIQHIFLDYCYHQTQTMDWSRHSPRNQMWCTFRTLRRIWTLICHDISWKIPPSNQLSPHHN